jgi:hypothetical protein
VEREAEMAVFRLGEESLRTFVPYFFLPYGASLDIESPVLVDRLAEVSKRVFEHYEAMASKINEGTKG